MSTAHSERRTPSIRQFLMVMAAVTWLALILPVGARAAGQLVTLVDSSTSTQSRVESSGALRVAEYNDPARTPYTYSVSVPISSGSNNHTGNLTTVPAGSRLVIETVSIRVALPAGERAVYNTVTVANTLFYIPITFAASYSGTDYFVGSAAVHLYANPGNTLQAGWARNSTSGNGYEVISLSGHYVKL